MDALLGLETPDVDSSEGILEHRNNKEVYLGLYNPLQEVKAENEHCNEETKVST